MVKTPPFHGGIMGSNPVRVIVTFIVFMENYPSLAEGNGLENRQVGSAHARVRISHSPLYYRGMEQSGSSSGS
ncbi:protein of unknown function [Latilactobacillus sakei]|nr:protein of unknown function [Latilactobacillus sakei]